MMYGQSAETFVRKASGSRNHYCGFTAYLVRLATCYIVQALPVIIIVTAIIIVGFIAYRIWKRKHDSNW